MSRQLAGPIAAGFLLLLGSVTRNTLAQKPVEPSRVGGAVTRPELISKEVPVYTEAARKARIQGTVILEAVIGTEGDVTDVRVLKGLPMGLDEKAVEAVKRWKFKPATAEGTPVAVYYALTINFQLSGPYQGPAFTEFLKQHPDFAKALNEKRYAAAAAFLDGSPQGQLPQIYLLLEQGLVADALRAVPKEPRDASREEMLRAVTSYALLQAQADLAAETRREMLELGLQAAAQAIADRPDSPELLLDKNVLLKEKLNQITDEAEKKKLYEELDRLTARMEEIRKARP